MNALVRHAVLLAASLASLTFGLLIPGLAVLLVLVSFGLLIKSAPNFDSLHSRDEWPQSLVYYGHVYRRYITRTLAMVYALAFSIVQPSPMSLVLLILVSAYSVASLFTDAVVAAVSSLLVLIGFGGAGLLLFRPESPSYSPLVVAVGRTSIFISFVLAPWFAAVYHTVSRYYESLHEHGYVSERRFPLNLGVSAALAIFLTGVFIGGALMSIVESPIFVIPTALSGLGAAAATYDVLMKLRGELWSYATYSEDFVDEAVRVLREKLEEMDWRYEVKKVWRRRGVSATIHSPFKAKITVREWVHRIYIRLPADKEISVPIPVKTGSGTVIQISPGPSRAPMPLKKFIHSYLSALGLGREAPEWACKNPVKNTENQNSENRNTQ